MLNPILRVLFQNCRFQCAPQLEPGERYLLIYQLFSTSLPINFLQDLAKILQVYMVAGLCTSRRRRVQFLVQLRRKWRVAIAEVGDSIGADHLFPKQPGARPSHARGKEEGQATGQWLHHKACNWFPDVTEE